VSIENNFYRPKILNNNENEEKVLSYKNGRHPIIENLRKNFITNDLNMTEKKITFITGPNMGGKSTFMRTTALITLMAQIGSYVPAENCIITPFNNIFVRIGYNDDPLEGESTFYKEMKECGEILMKCNNSSNIVFLDEICRGTSYEDGILLSKGIIEYLVKNKVLGLISSHYLELGEYLKKYNTIKILYTSYKYEKENLKFLYKMEEGIIENSFGIKVAEMAGLPEEIIKNVYLMKG
jgi:DNA mismatch repair protein MutS